MDTKKLRQKILDLAIHGKLVPQDPNDEPASVLLERIRAEKEQLIKEGKIKAPKKSKSAGDTSHYPKDVPFEVPEGWVWTEIAEISTTINYGVSESAKPIGKYRLLRITDIQDGMVAWESVPFTDYPEDKASAFELSDGDLLFARTGATVGKSYLVKSVPKNTIFASYLIRIQYSQCVIPRYIKYFFESGYYWEQISSSSVGVGQPNVNGTSLGKLKIPLPPSSEQKRIVEEARKWMCIIDGLEFESDHLSKEIGAAKSKVLDLAIHGKLVPQYASEEPAINLLRHINPAFQPSDNLHYEGKLPNGWCFSTIGDLFQHNTGKALNGKDQAGEELRYITTSNLYWDRFDLNGVRTMPFTEAEKEKCRATKGDLLVCEGGDIGRTAIWPYDFDVMIQNHIHRLRPREDLSVRFFYYVFLLYKQMGLIGGKGIAILGLSSRELDKMVVPVPPVPEQHRIVTVIENLFAQTDALTSNLS